MNAAQAGAEFVQLARRENGRVFDGSRLKAIKDIFGGVTGFLGGFGISAIDSYDDIGAVAIRIQPLALFAVKFTTTKLDDKAVEWLFTALQNEDVQKIIFQMFFVDKVTVNSKTSDEDLTKYLESASLAVAA